MERNVSKVKIVAVILELILLVVLVISFSAPKSTPAPKSQVYQVSDSAEKMLFYLDGEPIAFSTKERSYKVTMDAEEKIFVLPVGKSLNDLWTISPRNAQEYCSVRERIFLTEVEIGGKKDVIYMQEIPVGKWMKNFGEIQFYKQGEGDVPAVWIDVEEGV